MKNLFKLTLLVLAILLPSTATAYDFEVDGIYYTTNGNEATVTNSPPYIYSGDVVIPSTVTYNGITYTVTAIGDNAFYVWDEEASSITSITIPNSVTTIGNSAFEHCYCLNNINIPNSVTTIGNNAFLYCYNLTSIVVESGNPKYDSRNNCNAIIETASNTLIIGCQNTTIPNTVTSIGNYAFLYCFGLASIDIPNPVTTIGDNAFFGCGGLRSVTIGNSVTTIGDYAFADCSSLTSINIPNAVTTIGDCVFEYCSSLTSINIPNSVTTIGNRAFDYCSSLTSINIPNSVTTIGSAAFQNCTGLTSVNITNLLSWLNVSFYDPDSNPLKYAHHLYNYGDEIKDLIIPNEVTSIGKYAFYGCSGLASVTIPNSVTSIGNDAFAGCTGLSSVTIPNSVTSIGNDAFAGCTGLSIVTIPNSVTTIGDNAFSNCSILNEVYSYITDPLHITMGFNVFSPYNSNRTLYVPEGTFEVYSTYSRWSDYFGSIVEMEFEPTAIAESIQLNVTTAGLNEGATLQLTAMVQPEEGTSKKMNWASSNPSIATVDDNGLVTTHSVGTATITAMTTDGSNLSASCTVTLLPVGLKGDVNEDGRLNISDVSDLIDMLLDR